MMYETVFTKLMNKRIVILAGRYIWRGLLIEEIGPFAILKDAAQVVSHSDTAITEEIELKECRVAALSIEAIFLESDCTWIKK